MAYKYYPIERAETMLLYGTSVYIRPLDADDAPNLLELQISNQQFLQPYEPVKQESYFTLQGQQEMIERNRELREEGSKYSFGIFLLDGGLIGSVNLSNVSRGVFQNCTIGYFIGEAYNGKGYMTEAVSLTLRFAFLHAGLHRVEAGAMPHNLRSQRVLEKAGFAYIGLSPYHVQINGAWEDHLLYSITKENYIVAE